MSESAGRQNNFHFSPLMRGLGHRADKCEKISQVAIKKKIEKRMSPVAIQYRISIKNLYMLERRKPSPYNRIYTWVLVNVRLPTPRAKGSVIKNAFPAEIIQMQRTSHKKL